MRTSGLVLLALGLILAFAVSDNISGVDLTVVGYILAGVGLVGLIASLMPRKTISETRNESNVNHNV